MNRLLLIFRLLWRIYFLLVFCLLLIFFYPFLFVIFLREGPWPSAFFICRVIVKSMLFAAGIRYRITYEEELKKDRVYIFCPNHSSYLDIVLSYVVIPFYFIFMGKSELGKVPLFNIFFKKMNVLVDRQSNVGSHKAYLLIGNEMDKGHSVVLFPEGKIPQNAPVLNAFKNGAFRLAVEKQALIVPVAFLTNWKIIPHNENVKNHGGPGLSRIIVHKPIETAGMSEANIPELKTRVFRIIQQTLNAAKIPPTAG